MRTLVLALLLSPAAYAGPLFMGPITGDPLPLTWTRTTNLAPPPCVSNPALCSPPCVANPALCRPPMESTWQQRSVETVRLPKDYTLGYSPCDAGWIAVERELHRQGYLSGDPDCIKDHSAVAAVRAFQLGHGLEVDGVVGPKTRAALGL